MLTLTATGTVRWSRPSGRPTRRAWEDGVDPTLRPYALALVDASIDNALAMHPGRSLRPGHILASVARSLEAQVEEAHRRRDRDRERALRHLRGCLGGDTPAWRDLLRRRIAARAMPGLVASATTRPQSVGGAR